MKQLAYFCLFSLILLSITVLAPLSPYERRSGQDEVIEIDKDEFESVSSLVRGRVKLTEVNQVLHLCKLQLKLC